MRQGPLTPVLQVLALSVEGQQELGRGRLELGRGRGRLELELGRGRGRLELELGRGRGRLKLELGRGRGVWWEVENALVSLVILRDPASGLGQAVDCLPFSMLFVLFVYCVWGRGCGGWQNTF